MFYSLTGKLIYTDAFIAVVECGGVGYKCFATLNTLRALPPPGNTVTLYTTLLVREDSMDLYGFLDAAEQDAFRLLTSVNGVGAKVAVSILSDLTPDRLALCILSGDAKSLQRANGVGAKLASRLVLELKDKVGGATGDEGIQSMGVASAAGNAAEAVAALVALGYSQSDASLAVGRLDSGLPVEQLIMEALKSQAKGN